MDKSYLHHSTLGKQTEYITDYNPRLLFPISRRESRESINVPIPLPFQGYDIWNGYELSWLNPQGKPEVGMAEIIFPCDTQNLIESKSIKLFLYSLHKTKFSSLEAIRQLITKDLSAVSGGAVQVKIMPAAQFDTVQLQELSGTCLDDLKIDVDTYTPQPAFLKTNDVVVTEKLTSNLLMTNCPVTNQPDWGSLQIHYQGRQIDHAGLLKYIISFRYHNEFHEQCVERMFMDILNYCQPEKLTVYARYTRRGGLDINPFRSNFETECANYRTVRQ